MRTKRRFLVFGALVMLFCALFIAVDVNAKSTRPGNCFLFPEGTNWYIFGNGFHNGCEDGSCTAGPIKGYDYMAKKGTPILAPFSGKTTATCHHDGVGNTVFAMNNGEYEFGVLHLQCDVHGAVNVQVGQQIGTVASIGKSSEPHAHVWFRKVGSKKNISDHDRFWQCIGQTPPGPDPTPVPTPSPPGDEDPDWLKKLKELRDNLLNWGNTLDTIIKWFEEHPDAVKVLRYMENGLDVLLKLINGQDVIVNPPEETPVPVVTPVSPVAPKVFEFSIPAQQPGNLTYQYNVRAFFAWPTSGYNLGVMQQMDMNNFEGYWEISPKQQTSVNQYFGTKAYEEGQGMRVPPGFNIGDGACNAASFVKHVLAVNSLQVKCDDPNHAPVPGVPAKDDCTVCIPTKKYPCQTKDIWVTNPNDFPVKLYWKIRGDTIQMWVEKEQQTVVPPPGTNLPSVSRLVAYCIGGMVALLAVIFFLVWLVPHKAGATLVWVKSRAPVWWMMIKSSFQEALRWWLVWLAVVVLFNPQLQTLLSGSLMIWLTGNVTVSNWKFAVLGVAFGINYYLRHRHYAKRVRTARGYYIWSRGKRGCVGNLVVGAMALLLFMLIASLVAGAVIGKISDPGSDPTPAPVPSPVAGSCALSEKVPERVRRWCDLITKYSTQFEIDPVFIAAVIDVESKGNPNAMSSCDAVGLMQIMPSDLTPKTIACGALSCPNGPCFKDRPTIAQLKDPDLNVKWGTRMLATYLRRYGSLAEAAHAYNRGGGQAYVDLIMSTYRKFLGR